LFPKPFELDLLVLGAAVAALEGVRFCDIVGVVLPVGLCGILLFFFSFLFFSSQRSTDRLAEG